MTASAGLSTRSDPWLQFRYLRTGAGIARQHRLVDCCIGSAGFIPCGAVCPSVWGIRSGDPAANDCPCAQL